MSQLRTSETFLEKKWNEKINFERFYLRYKTHIYQRKKKLHKFDHHPRSQGSLRLTGIQVGFENDFKKIIFRPGASKNKKTKKSNCLSWNLLDINTTTGYISGHKDVLSTSFKTRQCKLSERKPTKRIFDRFRIKMHMLCNRVCSTQLANQWNCG